MKTCDFYKNELSCLNCPYPISKVPCAFDAYRTKKKRPVRAATPQGAQKKTTPKQYPKSKDLSTPRSVVRYVVADGRLYMPKDMLKQLGVSKDDPVLIVYDDGKIIVMPMTEGKECLV